MDKQDKERENTDHETIPVKLPQTLHTMRFSIMKLFWAISCISSFSAKAFFSAGKDRITLKSISNAACPSVLGHHVGQRLGHIVPVSADSHS